MNTVYDVMQLLKRFHTFIYTGDRIGDLVLMEMELDELFQFQFINKEDYLKGKLILKKEKSKISSQTKEKSNE